MNKYFLKDLAKIDISGVDKKIRENEIEVKLCNFTDVYNNWAITKNMYNKFMIATANKNEIDRYKLKKGMIAITKDSETREDIGMSTYIADSFENVILGYHTALIIPDNKRVNSKYLNAYLNSNIARKHFTNSASGSGQRYTLTIDSIGNLPLYLPSLEIQQKIGEILSYIDRKIELNSHINNNLEEMMKILYQRWFLEFEFPNEDGKPYKSSGGKFVFNDKVKQEIPLNWNVEKLLDIAKLYQPQTISTNQLIINGKYNVYGANGIIGKYDKYNHEENEIAITCRGASCGNKVMTMPYAWITGNAMVVKPNSNKEYLYYSLPKEKIMPLITGSAQPQLTRDNFNTLNIIIPEENIINNFEKIANKNRMMMQNIFNENQHLIELRDYLLPMLMNGQINVDDVKI